MAKAPYSKSFISHPDQIALLKSRGMKFADENKALHLLENISYYRFSGYWYPLLADKQNHVFKPDTDFETAFNLYKFDRELRQLLGSELEKIEVAIRAKMAYLLSMEYGAFWMEDIPLFANPNHAFKQKLETLFLKYPNVDKAAMGFPNNWHIEPLWK